MGHFEYMVLTPRSVQNIVLLQLNSGKTVTGGLIKHSKNRVKGKWHFATFRTTQDRSGFTRDRGTLGHDGTLAHD